MKMKVQAQHLQAGDIVGSGEKVFHVVRQSITLPSNKVAVYLGKGSVAERGTQWGKYTQISIERPEINLK